MTVDIRFMEAIVRLEKERDDARVSANSYRALFVETREKLEACEAARDHYFEESVEALQKYEEARDELGALRIHCRGGQG